MVLRKLSRAVAAAILFLPSSTSVEAAESFRYHDESSSPTGWTTCGGLTPMRNRTACPPTATCCHFNWAMGDGGFGCVDNDWGDRDSAGFGTGNLPLTASGSFRGTSSHRPAVCCSNNYTACPFGHTCVDHTPGAKYGVVTTCVPTSLVVSTDGASAPNAVTGKQICKQGAPLPLSDTLPNILVVGDSISNGYTPHVKAILQDEAFVQHSPWDVRDGGAEEIVYGRQCLKYLLSAPDGTALHPDVLLFNWGMHSCLPKGRIIPGQVGDPTLYAENLEVVVGRIAKWASEGGTKLLFAFTTPFLNSEAKNDLIMKHNADAKIIMARHNIATVDLHHPIVEECGPVPSSSCWGQKHCWSPHCPCHKKSDSRCGYAWLAESTIVPALRSLLSSK